MPLAVQKRWESRVASAGAALAAGIERRKRAAAIAKQTGEDVGAVWDRLVKEGK